MSCYDCKFRRGIPGDAHSECTIIPTPEYRLMVYAITQVSNGIKTDIMDVQLNPHGVRNGWAAWPINFDPIWVDKCNLFREKSCQDG